MRKIISGFGKEFELCLLKWHIFANNNNVNQITLKMKRAIIAFLLLAGISSA